MWLGLIKLNQIKWLEYVTNARDDTCIFSDSYKPFSRLQLKRGLFWYRHHTKIPEMVSDRCSRAEHLTIFCEMSMHVFFNSKKCGKMRICSKKHTHVVFRETTSLRSYTGHTKVGKIKFSDIIYLSWINLIIYN